MCNRIKKKDCAAPFKLFCFPRTLRNSSERCKWVQLLKRETTSKSKWEPCNSDRVCSHHFIDGQPSANNPYPTINMGYENKNDKSKPRRIIKKFHQQKLDMSCASDVDMLPAASATEESDSNILDVTSTILTDHSYALPPYQPKCVTRVGE